MDEILQRFMKKHNEITTIYREMIATSVRTGDQRLRVEADKLREEIEEKQQSIIEYVRLQQPPSSSAA